MVKRKKLTPLGYLLVIVGVVFAFLFVYMAINNLSEIDTKVVGDSMVEPANNMTKLRSVGGSSVAEKYYQYEGEYLKGEAKIYNAEVRFQRRTAIAADLIGIIACIFLISYAQKFSVEEKEKRKSSSRNSFTSTKKTKIDSDEF